MTQNVTKEETQEGERDLPKGGNREAARKLK